MIKAALSQYITKKEATISDNLFCDPYGTDFEPVYEGFEADN